MWKFLFLLLLNLYSIKSVSGLECYTSDYRVVLQRTAENSTHRIEDCQNYYNRIFKRTRQSRRLPAQTPANCFTVFVETVERNFEIKGCTPTTRCGIVRRFVQRRVLNQGNRVRSVTCTICNTNGCNTPDLNG